VRKVVETPFQEIARIGADHRLREVALGQSAGIVIDDLLGAFRNAVDREVEEHRPPVFAGHEEWFLIMRLLDFRELACAKDEVVQDVQVLKDCFVPLLGSQRLEDEFSDRFRIDDQPPRRLIDNGEETS
jgi:hypothetical protein